MTSREAPTQHADQADRVATGPAAPQRDFSWAVYGSLLVTTLLVVESQAIDSPDFIGLSIVVSICVFWLAHAWSEIVGLRVRGPIGLGEVRQVVRDQATILAAAIVPVAILFVQQLGFFSVDTAITFALLVSIAQLFAWGLLVGRAAGAGWPGTLAIATIDCALGLVIVAIKAVAIH
jgi:hypothetical protein